MPSLNSNDAYIKYDKCELYSKYSGNNFSNVDFLYQSKENILYLIEYKKGKPKIFPCIKKFLDAMSMIISGLFYDNSEFVDELSKENIKLNDNMQIKLLLICGNANDSDKTIKTKALKEHIKNNADMLIDIIKPYKELWNISEVKVLHYSRAKAEKEYNPFIEKLYNIEYPNG